MAAPLFFRSLSRHFCSHAHALSPPSPRSLPAGSFRLERFLDIAKPGASIIFTSEGQDKKLVEWYAWFGPRWWMTFEFAEKRRKYPKIPVEETHVGMLLGEEQRAKLRHAMSINVYSVVVQTDFKGQEVVKRTMLVMGRDVKELEAAAKRINKFRSLFIWNK